MKHAKPLIALAALSALLAVPPGSADDDSILAVVYDQFVPIDPAVIELNDCADARMERLPDGFAFQEISPGEDDAGPNPVFPGGYASAAWCDAYLNLTSPGPMEHLHVRFLADRSVEEYDVSPPGYGFRQTIEVYAEGADRPPAQPVFGEQDGPSPELPVSPPPFQVPPSGPFTVHWNFEDTNHYLFNNAFTFALSGEDYASRVRQVVLEYSGLRVDGWHVHEHDRREGSVLLGETVVAVPSAGPDSNLRLRAEKTLAFDRVVAPDGTVLRETVGPDPERGYGPTLPADVVLVEADAGDYLQVTVSRDFVRAHGEGEYKVYLTSVDTIQTIPWLVPIVALILLVPLPFAFFAYRRVRVYEREAFGAYRRSARNLRIALVVTLLYYATVVASALVAGRLRLLTVWPMPVEAILIYVQVVVAVGAFVALYSVANEMYRVIAPPKPAASRPGSEAQA
jgi:hypothetical protein